LRHEPRRPARFRLLLAVVLVATVVATGAALYGSYAGLVGVARLAGWDRPVRPALPLTVDVIAIAAGVLYACTWLGAELRDVARRGVVWSAVVSVGGNAVYHLSVVAAAMTSHHISPGAVLRAVLAVVVSAVPAVGIGYVVHLLSLLNAHSAPEHNEHQGAEHMPTPAPAPTPPTPPRAPLPAPDRTAARTEPPAPLRSVPPSPPQQRRPVAGVREGSKIALGLQMLADNPDITDAALIRALGCTPRHVSNIRQRAGEMTAA
jgi:hypothetical protein